MSGVAPHLPESGWRILYREAFVRFVSNEHNLDAVGPVADWVVERKKSGPPTDGVDAGDDYYLSPIPGTRIVAEYLIVESEYLIIVREFR